MPVEIFGRTRFEQVLGKFPLAYKLRGAKSGQLEYVVPIASRLHCNNCGRGFYVASSKTRKNTCPYCGYTDGIPSTAVQAGEMNLIIYSSIDARTGLSRNTGKDSIRLVLEGKGTYSKVGRYITRLPGWEDRLLEKARELWAAALAAPRCKRGHKGMMYEARSGQNKGRRYWKCIRCHEWLGWVEE